MVQILPEVKSFGQEFAGSIGRGVGKGISSGMETHRKMQELAKENEAIKRETGIDLTGINDPEARQKAFVSAITEKKKNEYAEPQNKKTYEAIKNRFGEENADLYSSLTTGGQSSFIERLLENEAREQSLGGKIGEQEEIDEMKEDIQPGISEKKQPLKKQKQIDFDKGLTPKERVKRQDDRYAKNLPFSQESQAKKQSYEYQKEELDILSELSPKIGVIERLNINPQTGQLIFPAAASPEAQRFVKTINDFTTQAKDSYGSRVTNFDLNQFMKRLPTLANSEEGRRQIIEQMQIINDINIARENALQNIIDEYGGIRNIDYDRAKQMAEKRAKPEIEVLKREFKKIGKDYEKTYEEEISKKKRNTPKGLVLIEIDGQLGHVPEGEVKQAIKEGARVL